MEITPEGFMSQGDRSWCHVISDIGHHFGLAGWLAGYVAQIAFISCANVFLAAFSWRHPFLSCAISTIKNFTRDRMQRSQNKVVYFSWDYNQPILFASQWQFPKDPRNHAHDWKQRRLHLVLIFECTFQWLITCASGYFFFSTVFFNKTFLNMGLLWFNGKTKTAL